MRRLFYEQALHPGTTIPTAFSTRAPFTSRNLTSRRVSSTTSLPNSAHNIYFTDNSLKIGVGAMKNRLTDRLFKGPYLESTSSAFALLVPVFIIGSIVVLALNFPLPGYAEYMEESFGADWKDSVMIIYELTFGLMGLFISGSIAYSLSIHKFDEENTAYIVGVISMIGFLLNSYRGQHGIDFNVTGPANHSYRDNYQCY